MFRLGTALELGMPQNQRVDHVFTQDEHHEQTEHKVQEQIPTDDQMEGDEPGELIIAGVDALRKHLKMKD